MDNYQDFGFSSDEYNSDRSIVPYAQFLNGSTKKFGFAITSDNAELANLDIDRALKTGWESVDHEFRDGSLSTLICSQTPRLLIINRSDTYMSNDVTTILYDKETYAQGGYKAFSYAVVLPLDENNYPLSDLPLRLKCSGYSGLTFLKNYKYWNNTASFAEKMLGIYKELTNDRALDKNNVFYAHCIYRPIITRNKVTSSVNGESSFAVVTDSFISPTKERFGDFIIKNGSPVSSIVVNLIESTDDWIALPTNKNDSDATPSHDDIKAVKESIIDEFDGQPLTPDPIAF